MTAINAPGQPAAPVKARKPGLGAAWFLLITMGGAELTFNIYHADRHAPASHAAHHAVTGPAALPLGLAILSGVIPVLAATVVSHLIAEFAGNKTVAVVGSTIMEIAAFVAMLLAMAISTDATASVVRPVFGPVLCWGLPAVMDVPTMVALRIILKYAEAGRAQTSGSAVPGTAGSAGNRDHADGSGNHSGGSRNQAVNSDGHGELVPAGGSGNHSGGSRNQAVDSDGHGELVPAGGSGNHAAPAAGSGGAGASPVPRQPARPVSPAARESPAPRPDRPAQAGEGRESRDAVTDEMTSRPRPPLESTQDRERRALDIVAEFRARTGLRMNNGELARVLGMRKADIGPVRAAIQDREESAA